MTKSYHTLKEIADTKPKQKKETPKSLREEQIKTMRDWYVWNHLANENNKKELSEDRLESQMLLLVKQQFKKKDDLYLYLARMLTKIVQHRANEKVAFAVLTNLNKSIKKLEEVEKITNKGGRPPNQELFDVAKCCFDKFFDEKGRSPTSGELSRLVDIKMVMSKGFRKRDKWDCEIEYLSKRTAREIINKIKHLYAKDSRQELVKSITN
jgi:hypothetical protein